MSAETAYTTLASKPANEMTVLETTAVEFAKVFMAHAFEAPEAKTRGELLLGVPQKAVFMAEQMLKELAK